MTKAGLLLLWALFMVFALWVDPELGVMFLFGSFLALGVSMILWGLLRRASTSR